MNSLRASWLGSITLIATSIGICVINYLTWHHSGSALVISDDAEFIHGSIRFVQDSQPLSDFVKDPNKIIGGRASAVSFIALFLIGGLKLSVLQSKFIYSFGSALTFWIGCLALGRAMKLTRTQSCGFLIWLALDPTLFRSLIGFYSEPGFLALLPWSLWALISRRWVLAGALLGVSGFFRPFEAARLIGITSFVYFFFLTIIHRQSVHLISILASATFIFFFKLSSQSSEWILLASILIGGLAALSLKRDRTTSMWLISFSTYTLLTWVWFSWFGNRAWLWAEGSSGSRKLDFIKNALSSPTGGITFCAIALSFLVGWKGIGPLLASSFAAIRSPLRANISWTLTPLISAAAVAGLIGLIPNRDTSLAFARFMTGELFLILASAWIGTARSRLRLKSPILIASLVLTSILPLAFISTPFSNFLYRYPKLLVGSNGYWRFPEPTKNPTLIKFLTEHESPIESLTIAIVNLDDSFNFMMTVLDSHLVEKKLFKWRSALPIWHAVSQWKSNPHSSLPATLLGANPNINRILIDQNGRKSLDLKREQKLNGTFWTIKETIGPNIDGNQYYYLIIHKAQR